LSLGRADPALQDAASVRADAASFPLLIDLACSDSHASDTLTLTPMGYLGAW